MAELQLANKIDILNKKTKLNIDFKKIIFP